jgi:hypothetical protein
MRHDVGLQSNSARNHRENALSSENPSRCATSLKANSLSSTYRRAKSFRTALEDRRETFAVSGKLPVQGTPAHAKTRRDLVAWCETSKS